MDMYSMHLQNGRETVDINCKVQIDMNLLYGMLRTNQELN